MEKVEVYAYAKVNLSLNVLGRADNMHELDMVLASINVYDIIKLQKRNDDNISFECKMLKEDNNAVLALKLFKERFNTKGFDLKIEKHIPFSAGLGGSSADASGVLRALCTLYEIPDTNPVVKEIAKKVGSDVYAMLLGGFVRVKGTGDIVSKINTDVTYNKMLVLKCKKGVSTKECFDGFDNGTENTFANNEKMEELLTSNDKNIYPYMHNMLEKSAIELNSDIAKVMKAVNEFKPLKVMLTGSGSGVIALFSETVDVFEIESKLRKKVHYVRAISTVKAGTKVVNLN